MKKSLISLLIAMLFICNGLFSQVTQINLIDGTNVFINSEITSDVTLTSGTLYMTGGDLHIRRFGKLTISKDAVLGVLEKSKIVVHPGGELIVKGIIFPYFFHFSPITPSDNLPVGVPEWQGIQVLCQNSSIKGIARIEEGTICNANIGISNFAWDRDTYCLDSISSYEYRTKKGGRITAKDGFIYGCSTGLAIDITGLARPHYLAIQPEDFKNMVFSDEYFTIIYDKRKNYYYGEIIQPNTGELAIPFFVKGRSMYQIEVNATGCIGRNESDLDQLSVADCKFKGEKLGVLSLDYDLDVHRSFFLGLEEGFVAYKTSKLEQLGNISISDNKFLTTFRGVSIKGYKKISVEDNLFCNEIYNTHPYKRADYPCGLFLDSLGEGYLDRVTSNLPDRGFQDKLIQDNIFVEFIECVDNFSCGIVLVNPSDNIDMNYLLEENYFSQDNIKLYPCDIDVAGFKIPKGTKSEQEKDSSKKIAETSDDSVNSGVKDIKTLTITPNPVQGQFRIETPIQESIVRVYSINGVEQYTKIVDSKTTEINTLDWVNGIYSITIENAGQVISTGKVCVSN